MRELTRETLDAVVGDCEAIDAESLHGVDLDAHAFNGKTALEILLRKFQMVAVGDDFDCKVSGCYEAHLSIITLLEAGASVTDQAKIILKEIQKEVKAIKKDPQFYALGAEREIDTVLACVKKSTAASRKRAKASVATSKKQKKSEQVTEHRFTEA